MGKPAEINMPPRTNYNTCREYANAVLNTMSQMEQEIYKAIRQLTQKRIEIYTKLIESIKAKIPTFSYKLSEVASQYLILPEVTAKSIQYPKMYYAGNLRPYKYCRKQDGNVVCSEYDLIPVPELTFDLAKWQDMFNAMKSGIPDFNIRGYMFMRRTLDEGGDVCDAKWCYSFAELLDYRYTVSPSAVTVPCPDNPDILCDLAVVLGNDTGIGVYRLSQSISYWQGEMWYATNKEFAINLISAVAIGTLEYKSPSEAELPEDVRMSVVIAIPEYCCRTGSGLPSDCYWTPFSSTSYLHNVFFGNTVLEHAMGIVIGSIPNAKLVPFVFIVGTNAYDYASIVSVLERYMNVKPVRNVLEGYYKKFYTLTLRIPHH